MKTPQDPEAAATVQTTSDQAVDPAATCSRLLDPSNAPKDGTVILAHFGWPHFVPTFWCRHLEEWVTAQPEACAPGEMQFFESDTELHSSMQGWMPIPNLPENS